MYRIESSSHSIFSLGRLPTLVSSVCWYLVYDSPLQLVELLEVPQLMDACVRSDLLEEALSIATFASTLERRHRNRRAIALSRYVCVEEEGECGDGGWVGG